MHASLSKRSLRVLSYKNVFPAKRAALIQDSQKEGSVTTDGSIPVPFHPSSVLPCEGSPWIITGLGGIICLGGSGDQRHNNTKKTLKHALCLSWHHPAYFLTPPVSEVQRSADDPELFHLFCFEEKFFISASRWSLMSFVVSCLYEVFFFFKT